MTLWHASTELHATSGTAAVVAKTVYLAAQLMGLVESGLVLDLGTERAEQSAELDTSG
jgi:hypothetical protein